MELLLNLSWLVIALTAIFVFRGSWRRRDEHYFHQWVALATLLFLLFPVISLTDDLHPEVALAEAATGKRHLHLLSAHGPGLQAHASNPPGVRAIVFQNRSCPALVPTIAALIERCAPAAVSAPAKVTSGRSPPSILL
jgi:hypothetical protein